MVDALIRLGDDRSALALLQDLLRQSPEDRKLHRRLADELHRLERYEDAERIYDALLQSTPTSTASPTPTIRRSLETRTVGTIAE